MNESALGGPTVRHLEHDGQGVELWPMVIKNSLLKLLTLGVYHFWAATEIRRYLWSRTRFDGDPLEWTGTGKELFKGFVAVFLLILLPLGALSKTAQYLQTNDHKLLGGVLGIAVAITYASLMSIGLYRARRYRLSRTLWRGIRGTQTGSAVGYAARWLLWTLLMFPTLGLILPVRNTALARYKLNHTVFGDRSLICKAHAGSLYTSLLLSYLGLVLLFFGIVGAFVVVAGALGATHVLKFDPANNKMIGLGFGAGFAIFAMLGFVMVWAIYQVQEIRLLVRTTRWGDLTFRTDLTVGGLIGLTLPNMLIVFFTLGMALPYAQLRRARFVARHLEIIGDQNFALVAQNHSAIPGSGEGLIGIFDGVDI